MDSTAENRSVNKRNAAVEIARAIVFRVDMLPEFMAHK